jgi:hypothetical protein
MSARAQREMTTNQRTPNMTHPEYPYPTPEMLESPEFEAVWQAIKKWDICRDPTFYIERGERTLYHGATGSDVRHILDALASIARVA